MKYRTGNELRKLFLEFFKEKGHLVEKGVSLVPVDDPSLLWINSGVSALKKYFDGSIALEIPRIVNSQRALRTNDIENVGVTARHHTMFEMLGNFSIGDYFKKEAISYAWEFLTDPKWVGMDKDKLYVTVYPSDEESQKIWREEIGLSEDRIFKLPGNFWEIGAGPCGPNTEIFYDRGIAYDPENIGLKLLAEDLDNDRYIEIWNIVFSQFNAEEGVAREDYQLLPQKNIDTGMGLERLTSIVQETPTNFETDLFMPIIKEIEKHTTISYESNPKPFKIIADHIRALTFALADGAMISNEGRGYVLKRILRRASRYGFELGFKQPFLYNLVDNVIAGMEDYYPYLNDKKELIKKIIKVEEERFHRTISDGLKIFEEVKDRTLNKIISGIDAFKLYDTYGFPIEMVQELSEEVGFEVDLEGFNEEMLQQQTRARANAKDSSNMGEQSADLLKFKDASTFVGYDNNEVSAKIIGLFQNGNQVDSLNGEGEIVFDNTVFYAESGGQVSDKGTLIIDDIAYDIMQVRKAPNGQHLHLVDGPNLKIGQEVILKIDNLHRKLVARNHSATHLLHKALKEVVGSHLNQAGSYVNSEYLRFDFNHYEKINDEQLCEVERIVNEQIFLGLSVCAVEMDLKQAKETGAMALFDQKYDNKVRVVSMDEFSKELCGGTHISNTAEIGLLKIQKEESVGSGIRRITALTSQGAYDYLNSYETKIKKIAHSLQEKNVSKVVQKLGETLKNYDEVKNNYLTLKKALNDQRSSELMKEYTEVNNKKVFVLDLSGSDIKEMKEVIDRIKNENEQAIGLVYNNQDKHSYVVGVSKDLITQGVTAKDIAKLINETFGGRGGGKPDMAQGGHEKEIDKELFLKLIK